VVDVCAYDDMLMILPVISMSSLCFFSVCVLELR
jgi:hypothetical protein